MANLTKLNEYAEKMKKIKSNFKTVTDTFRPEALVSKFFCQYLINFFRGIYLDEIRVETRAPKYIQ